MGCPSPEALRPPACSSPCPGREDFGEGSGGPVLPGPQPQPVASPQVPIHALWNDGRENLLGALIMAGQYVIPEVLAWPGVGAPR